MADDKSHFNDKSFTWVPYLKEWEESWRKANPGYPKQMIVKFKISKEDLTTDYPDMINVLKDKILNYQRESERCPTCQGRFWNVKHGKWVSMRVTKGLVCQTCGRDYLTSDHKDEGNTEKE